MESGMPPAYLDPADSRCKDTHRTEATTLTCWPEPTAIVWAGMTILSKVESCLNSLSAGKWVGVLFIAVYENSKLHLA